MSVNIGNGNKIKNSTIAETVNDVEKVKQKKRFYDRHPVICGFLISLSAGIIFILGKYSKLD